MSIMKTTYRAAWFKGTVLTGPEHAALSDAELCAEALSFAIEAGIIDLVETDPETAFPRLTREQFDAGLTIGDWTEE